MKVFEIPQKLRVDWNDEVKAMIDTWTTYNISLNEFRQAILTEGVNFAKSRNVKAWIVDSSSAKGVFTQEIHKFIETDIFPAFAKIGVKYFITINSSVSAITQINVKKYSSITGPFGLQLVELNNVNDAISWLKKH